MEIHDDGPTEDSAEYDRNGIEILARSECVRLLAERSVGRIGVSSGALPAVFPVNYHFDGSSVFVRTGPDSTLHDLALDDEIVAFEIDDVDPLEHSGWSVLVTGRASEVTSPDIAAGVARDAIPRWAPGDGANVVAIDVAFISGRRLSPMTSARDLPPQLGSTPGFAVGGE